MGESIPDPTMLELFAAEVETHLPSLSEGLLAIEKGRAGKTEIESMMRAAHSIKGAARIVGIDYAVRIAHAMEDCFSAAKEERITLSSSDVDKLLQAVDGLQRICGPQTDEAFGEDAVAAILKLMAQVKEGKGAGEAKGNAPEAPVATLVSMDAVVFPESVDVTGAESLRKQLLGIMARRPERVRIDFSRVNQMSAPGLALLLSFASEVKAEHLDLAVEAHGVPRGLRALFRVVGLDGTWLVRE